MFRFLRGEMVKADITIAKLAELIGISEKSLRNKLNGITEFTWSEVLEIRKIVSPSILDCGSKFRSPVTSLFCGTNVPL